MKLSDIFNGLNQKPECNCPNCKRRCTEMMCLGTPEDILRLIRAGYKDLLAVMEIGIAMNGDTLSVKMVQLKVASDGCVLHKDGKCLIESTGLVPLEGKLLNHLDTEIYVKMMPMIIVAIAVEWKKDENREQVAKCFEAIY